MYASVAGNRDRQRATRRGEPHQGHRFGALGLVLIALAGTVPQVAWAQPATLPGPTPAAAPSPTAPMPAPAPGAPAPGAPAPGAPAAGKPAKPPVESVDNNQTLGSDDERPWAAGVSDENQSAALRMFREGNASLNEGVFVTAVKRYRQALEQWDHPAIHYNLALALMNLDQPIEVYQSLAKALKYDPKAGPAPLDSDKYDRAKNYMLLAQKQVANVDITCDKPGAKVAVDGNVVFTGPGRYQGLVRVGKHSFVAEKAGYVTSVEAPYIGPGETMRFTLKLFSAEELTRHKRMWKATWIPWTVAGTGGAIAIASGVLYAAGRSDIQDFDARITQCGTMGCEITSELQDMRQSGDTKQTMAWVGFGLGAATIATGFVLAYVNRIRPYQIRPEDLQKEAAKRPGVASSLTVTPLVPVAGSDITGAAASFRF
jgi:PEGA domain